MKSCEVAAAIQRSADLQQVAMRAMEDFEQRTDNTHDYPEDTIEWYAYAYTYSILRAEAVATGAAV